MAPDGLYDSQIATQNEQNRKDNQHSVLKNVVNGAQQAAKRGLIVPDTLKVAVSFIFSHLQISDGYDCKVL